MSTPATPAVTERQWTREHPYTATLLGQKRLTSTASTKDVRHIEIALGDSGISYQPGDTLAVIVQNDPALVAAILDICGLSGQAQTIPENSSTPLFDMLCNQFEITQVYPGFLKRLAALHSSLELKTLTDDPTRLRQYLDRRQIIDVLLDYPLSLTPEQLLDCLRPLTARQYSIASSPLICPDRIALTVAHLEFMTASGRRQGAGSGFLCERLRDNAPVQIYPVVNPNFRLPGNSDLPVIMIGPGTGIAPFRAFLQHREASGATGANWLFFGNPHQTTDFLYEDELRGFVARGVLGKLSLAFSRDQAEKRYVQHLMLEQASSLFTMLEQGASLYVCGDAKRMADDVQKALLEIIGNCGGLDPAAARQYLVNLRQEKRYQRDVY